VLDILKKPSEEPYWKLRYKGGCYDIFFLTTMDRVPQFIKAVYEAADSQGYPSTDIGIYIQPIQQGRSCHCEFNLPYDPSNPREVGQVRDLFMSASNKLIEMGGFFSRPYGPWADMVYNRNAAAKEAVQKVKNIFDPNNIMNPGKLCF
jgi:FAD/FMN-containing dehydrogenase